MRAPLLLPVALLAAAILRAQAPGLAGDWDGALEAGGARLRLTLHVTKTDDGLYLGELNSLDQGSIIPMDKATVNGNSVRLEFPLVKGIFTAELSADGSKLSGTWSQGTPLPLTLTRSAKPPAAEPAKPAAPRAPRPLGAPIDVVIPKPPMAVIGAGGRTNLFYELHITNFSGDEMNLTRIEVFADAAPLATFEGTELIGILMRPGFRQDLPDARKIGPGLRAVAYMWEQLPEGGQPPATLRHKITVSDMTVDLAPLTLPREKPIVLGPPVHGSDWLAANGPGNRSIHRRAIVPVGGRAALAERYAIDWLQLKDGATFVGDQKDNKSYRAYGAELLAVADGTVVAIKDGIPENVPGPTSRAVAMNLDTMAGNFVELDVGSGHYCLYAHLQPGSLKVKAGDHVKRGQVLGLLGNSGNSTEPHLHFHVTDGPSPLGSEGVPYVIDAFELQNGQNPGKRQNALPMQNMLVRFP